MAAPVPSEIVFPVSSKATKRTLVFRNRWHYDIICLSDRNLLRVDPWCDAVPAYETRTSTVTFKGYPKDQKGQAYINIFARVITSQKECDRRLWIDGDVHKDSQLACRLAVVTSPTYAALETLIDLPGNAIMVESEVHPTLDVDDRDTLTAMCVDSDMTTAARLHHHDLIALADDEADTARALDSGVITSRHSLVTNGGYFGWLSSLFNLLFPPADADAKEVVPCGGGK
ncbi:hypothetical protein QR680_004026 [Steinernema hermaphroditum]|uniref:Uncharacterized protein n=1 Tax=Steinernema hermaphroditum TaxID=289476 RepID=A0AA39HMF4_9BILA|nr:hypothetical protein QR680_004026 [Steinernema hermaphroditum]